MLDIIMDLDILVRLTFQNPPMIYHYMKNIIKKNKNAKEQKAWGLQQTYAKTSKLR